MKTIKTIILLFVCAVSCAQNYDKRFTVSINTEPNAIIKDGFNFGVNIDYQMTYTYFKAGIYSFPDLNKVGYFQYHGAIGLNKHLGLFEDSRVYLGLVLGANFRQGNSNPIAGVEVGYQYYISEKIGIGVNASELYRGDSKYYGSDRVVYNGSIELIFKIGK